MRQRLVPLFSLGLVVALVVLGGAWAVASTAEKAADRASVVRIRLGVDVERIRYYDELLTMSARLAAATGDSAFVERYHRAVPELDQIISDAMSVALDPASNEALKATEQANQELIALEEESFSRLAAGDRAGAYATLTSDDYDRKKAEYARGMDVVINELQNVGIRRQAEVDHARQRGLAASIGGAALLLLLWVATALGLRRSERARSGVEAELRTQALHDPLTGLANRNLLLDRIGLAGRRRARGVIAVLYLDIDGFKVINDELGHPCGDEILIEVGSRLRTCVRPADTVARLGGDEFAVLVEDLASAEEVSELARRVGAALSVPFEVGGTLASCGASIGSVTIVQPDPFPEADVILRDADLAMYVAKRSGKGSWVPFDPRMYEEVVREVLLKAELQRALERDELSVHYQPIVDLRTGSVKGVEALVRWAHPERGMLAPAEFLGVAEETGLMPAITRRVLAEACEWATRRPAKPGEPPLQLAVNISASGLADPELTGCVERTLVETGLDPSRLCLEVTETTVLGDIGDTIRPLRSLRALGVTVAVDDFGTGYSSLTHLKRLPVDCVKIDQSFTAGVGVNLEDTTVTAAIIRLAHTLSLSTVAEGVETEAQLRALRDMGCDYAQGFLLGRPAPGDAPLPPPHLAELVARVMATAVDPAPAPSQYRVVIADDSEPDRRLVRRLIERSGRFTVVGEAENGRDVLDLVDGQRPDVVLLDLHMPGGDGFTALPRILEVAVAPLVVVLSGYVSDATVERALHLGASAVVQKSAPNIVEQLLGAVERPLLLAQ